MKSYKNIDEYIANFPKDVQEKLEHVRRVIRAAAPEATEAISYGIPTFKLGGKNLVHFAGYAHHIGFYPGAEAIEVFAKRLVGYKTSKGTVQFPLDTPIPYELINILSKWRVECLQRH